MRSTLSYENPLTAESAGMDSGRIFHKAKPHFDPESKWKPEHTGEEGKETEEAQDEEFVRKEGKGDSRKGKTEALEQHYTNYYQEQEDKKTAEQAQQQQDRQDVQDRQEREEGIEGIGGMGGMGGIEGIGGMGGMGGIGRIGGMEGMRVKSKERTGGLRTTMAATMGAPVSHAQYAQISQQQLHQHNIHQTQTDSNLKCKPFIFIIIFIIYYLLWLFHCFLLFWILKCFCVYVFFMILYV